MELAAKRWEEKRPGPRLDARTVRRSLHSRSLVVLRNTGLVRWCLGTGHVGQVAMVVCVVS